MTESRRTEIYNNLLIKDTEELLDIWQNGDEDGWDEAVFEIIEEILVERLDSLPPKSTIAQLRKLIGGAEEYFQNGDLEMALQECDQAIQIAPKDVLANHLRGLIYDEMELKENALADYRTAIKLDPEYMDAQENFRFLEEEMVEEFQHSTEKQNLDQALDYANEGAIEKALQACEQTQANLPNIAIAYNYLGLIFQTCGKLELAVDTYLNAVKLNPRFYAARQNLRDARVKLEDEQFRQAMMKTPPEESDFAMEMDESPWPEDVILPGWCYMNETAYFLPGWPGHRTRWGRSGYDPLELDFEEAHMEGVMIRWMFTRKLLTRNPVYLLFMTFLGLILCIPLFSLPILLNDDLSTFFVVLVFCPLAIIGAALLLNVFSSLRMDESDIAIEDGYKLSELETGTEDMENYEDYQEFSPDRKKIEMDYETTQDSKNISFKSIPSKSKNHKKLFVIAGILCITLFFAGGCYLFGNLLSYYLVPQKSITFEPVCSPLSVCNTESLQAVSEILTHRVHDLGYPRMIFSVTNNQLITAKVPNAVDTKEVADRIQATGLLEFVDFGDTLLPIGTLINTDSTIGSFPEAQGKKWHTVMTNTAIKEVSVFYQNNSYEINLEFTEEGAKQFAEYTTENIGKILGIVVDKKVISTPSINSAITAGTGTINGNFTYDQARNLAANFKSDPLPFPIILIEESSE